MSPLEKLMIGLGPTIRATEEFAQRKVATRDYVILAGLRTIIERITGVAIPPHAGDLAVSVCPRFMALRFLMLSQATDEVLSDVTAPITGDDMVVVMLDERQVGVVRLTRTDWAGMFPSKALDGPIYAAAMPSTGGSDTN